MSNATIVTDLHHRLDELFARPDVAMMEPESLGWPQAHMILGATIALDVSGRAARRILMHPCIDLRLVGEETRVFAYEGRCTFGNEAQFKARWDVANAAVLYRRIPTDENHLIALGFLGEYRNQIDAKPYLEALIEAVHETRDDHP